MTPTRRILPILLIATFATMAPAATIQVPGHYGTLAQAAAAANTGDVIELAPGVHVAAGIVLQTAVTIRGMGLDAGAVVLDGRDQDRILSIEHVDAPIWIQNLTFRNGFALGESTNLMSGGALFVSYSNVALQNCRFENNRAGAHGGAVRSIESRLRISQCDFVDNHAQLGGGAVDASYDADPVFLRCSFYGNTATWGGAVSSRGGASPVFEGCDFVENAAGSVLGYGGAVYADYSAAPSFDGCTFRGNTARLGGALACFQGSDVSVVRSTLVANASSEAGGAFFCLDGSPRIEASIIAFQEGTGITSEASGLPIVDCTGVWNNSGGDVEGPLSGGSAANLIAADPRFCGDPTAGGERFPLAPDSPLAAGSGLCETVGAWPVGCTAALPEVREFDAQLSSGYLTVNWRAMGDPVHDRYRLTWNDGGLEHESLITHQGDGVYTAFAEIPPEVGTDFTLQLYARGDTGAWESVLDPSVGTDRPDDGTPPPVSASLAVRNWPNPFNPTTTIAFDVPRDQWVQVSIYTAAGRRVATLHNEWTRQGTVELPWQGRDLQGRQVASGTYIVRVEGERVIKTHKISLLK